MWCARRRASATRTSAPSSHVAPLAGELEEAVLERRALVGELEDRDAVLGGDRADRLQRGALDDHRVGPAVGDDAGTLLLEQQAQLLEARRANEDRPPGALDEVRQRALHAQAARADYDDAVDGLLDLGQDVAGDEHGPPLGRQRD